MWLHPIEVTCRRPGGEADELPFRVRIGPANPWLAVAEVVDRWYEAGTHPEWPAARYYKVLASDTHTYLLKHDLESGGWFLVRRW